MRFSHSARSMPMSVPLDAIDDAPERIERVLHARHRRDQRLADTTVELVDEMAEPLAERRRACRDRCGAPRGCRRRAIGLARELGAEPTPERALRLLGPLEQRLDVPRVARRALRRLDVRLDLLRADGGLRLEAHRLVAPKDDLDGAADRKLLRHVDRERLDRQAVLQDAQDDRAALIRGEEQMRRSAPAGPVPRARSTLRSRLPPRTTSSAMSFATTDAATSAVGRGRRSPRWSVSGSSPTRRANRRLQRERRVRLLGLAEREVEAQARPPS